MERCTCNTVRLSYIRGNNRLTLGNTVNFFYYIRAGQLGVIILQRIFCFHFLNGIHPLPVILLLNHCIQFGKHLLQVSYQACIHMNVLVNLRLIDINMDYPCIHDRRIWHPVQSEDHTDLPPDWRSWYHAYQSCRYIWGCSRQRRPLPSEYRIPVHQ